MLHLLFFPLLVQGMIHFVLYFLLQESKRTQKVDEDVDAKMQNIEGDRAENNIEVCKRGKEKINQWWSKSIQAVTKKKKKLTEVIRCTNIAIFQAKLLYNTATETIKHYSIDFYLVKNFQVKKLDPFNFTRLLSKVMGPDWVS